MTPGISPPFAAGKLGGRKHAELDILVEDAVAADIVRYALTLGLRNRTEVRPVGSVQAVLGCMVTARKVPSGKEICVLLDGDHRSKQAELSKKFLDLLESCDDRDQALTWFKDHLAFLPSDRAPETWLLEQIDETAIEEIANRYNLPADHLAEHISDALAAGCHREFWTLADKLCIDEDALRVQVTHAALEANPKQVSAIQGFVEGLLTETGAAAAAS
ncbi:MAG TPA: hypothetical protein VML01_13295 [Bryobacterales bacterium]|nr:hypothetical protein [Bryobacterales bacterium]